MFNKLLSNGNGIIFDNVSNSMNSFYTNYLDKLPIDFS